MKSKVRVAIDCRISNPQQGIGTAVLGLAHALSDAADVGQNYTFIVPEDVREWIAPHIFGQCRLKTLPKPVSSHIKEIVRGIAPLRAAGQALRSRRIKLPVSDGYVESEGFNLVHFPIQAAYLTSLPSIYQPHDLQHVHYPEFFTTTDWALRENRYRAFCEQAEYVCVQTEWSRRDVIAQYGVPSEKLVVIPWGLVFDAYAANPEAERAAIAKFNLPRQFFFYPAVTWPHKNHEVIFRALHLLKQEHNRTIDVYFTGASTDFRTKLDRLAGELGVADQLHYLGFVSPAELQGVFCAATAMLFPSKFEGFGLPLLEAFHAGVPVISSNATVLPEVAGDAALYFDPGSAAELAVLMMEMLDKPEKRAELIAKGPDALSRFSFSDTAAKFQSLYARIAERCQITVQPAS